MHPPGIDSGEGKLEEERIALSQRCMRNIIKIKLRDGYVNKISKYMKIRLFAHTRTLP